MILPKTCVIPREILEMITHSNTHIVVEVTHKDGCVISLIPFDLSAVDDHTILLSLEQERSRAGEALIYSLWFEQNVRLWLASKEKTICLTLSPRRIHIVGKQFSHMLQRARKRDDGADVNAVWELWAEQWEETTKPVPVPLPHFYTGEIDCHLDRLLVP